MSAWRARYTDLRCHASLPQENNTLAEINLKGNNLDDRAAAPLSEALKLSTSLTKVDLSYNQFGEEAGKLFGEMLNGHSHLLEVNLKWNALKAKGGAAVAEGIKNNQAPAARVAPLVWLCLLRGATSRGGVDGGLHARECSYASWIARVGDAHLTLRTADAAHAADAAHVADAAHGTPLHAGAQQGGPRLERPGRPGDGGAGRHADE